MRFFFQNWSNVGHMRLCQKSSKIQYIFEKFFRMVNRHDASYFWIQKFFGSGLFLTFFWIWWIKKVPRSKKVVNEKNWFLHARQLCEGVFDVSSNRYCLFTIEVFFKMAAIIPILRIDVYKWTHEDNILYMFYENLG